MKKFLLSLAAVALTGVFSMAETVTVDFSDETTAALLPTTESATSSTVKVNGVDLEFVNCKNGKYSGATYLQLTGKSKTPKGNVSFTLAENCTKITITSGASGSTNVKVSLLVGTNAIKEDVQLSSKSADFAFEIPSDYQVAGTKYTFQVTNNYNAQISKIVFETEQGGSALTDAGLAFASETVNANLGEAVPANVLTKATDAAAVYTSSNEEVATVDAATGEVTLVAAGTTTIKATTEATDTYKAGEASYTLVVVDPNAKKEANLAFASATVTVDLAETAPTNELTKDTDAAVVYTSSNEEVATVDAATGVLTLVGEGTTTIKAAAEATENYEAGEASYTLTVTDKAAIVYESDCKSEDCGFTFEFGEGENPWTISTSYGLTGNAYSLTDKTADAYAVSPVLDLSNRIKPITMTQTFAYNYVTVDQIPEYFTIAVREEGATDWTVLMAAPAPEKMNKWTYVDDYTIDLNEYEGKKIQIGYRYVADGTVCGGWQIKDVLVKAKQKSAVSDIVVEDADAPVVYYNLQGVRVENPANGLYIRVQGKKATKVLVR